MKNIKSVLGRSRLQTVPRFVKDNPIKQFSLIYYNADFYEPTEIMFKYLAPKLSIGGVIILHEYGTKEWPGETKSANQFLSINRNFTSEKRTSTKQATLKITRVS